MQLIITAALALSALVAASPVAQPQASDAPESTALPAAAAVGDLRTSCRGAALLCCNPLQADDADLNQAGTGIYRSCNGIHAPFISSVLALEAACSRVAACCLTEVMSGPPEPALQCTSLTAVLAEDARRLEVGEDDSEEESK